MPTGIPVGILLFGRTLLVMDTGPVIRTVRLDDFTAEGLEAAAAALPPRDKIKADNFRQIAKFLRESDNPKTITVGQAVVPDLFEL
jgi:hypothetical protein